MVIKVEKWVLRSDDHLWLEFSKPNEYLDNYGCEGCGETMDVISMVTNCKGELGLITGLCRACGYVKRLRNLSDHWYQEHFSNKWLTRRNEGIVEDYYVFNKLSKYIPKGGKVLDIGCGLGHRLLPFFNAGFDVYGVDPSMHRSALASEIMNGIEAGVGEEYLDKQIKQFDAIYFFNVLQFVENPFLVLEKASNKLLDGGFIFFSVGQFYKDSNYCQFSHLGVLRSFLSLYSLKRHIEKFNLFPVEYSNSPFELILQKGFDKYSSSQILNDAKKINMKDLERYARDTLNPFRLKVFGKTSIKYQERKIVLQKTNAFKEMVPVIFQYDREDLPILLK